MSPQIASHDWSTSSVGLPEQWPASLHDAVAMLRRLPIPAILLWGPQGVLFYNDAYAEFGEGLYPHALGVEIRQAWPERAEFHSRLLEAVLAGQTRSYPHQECLLTRNCRTTIACVNLDYASVRDDAGTPVGVLGVVTFAQPSPATAEALRESEARFRSFFDNVAVGMVESDIATGRICSVNETLCRMLEYTADELLALPIEVYTFGQDLELNWPAFQAAMRAPPYVFKVETRLIAKSGRVLWVQISAAAIPNRATAPTTVAAIVEDITARKRREQNSEFLAALNAECMLLTRADEILRVVGQRLYAYLGVSRLTFVNIQAATGAATAIYDSHDEDVIRGCPDYQLAHYLGEDYLRDLNAGRLVVVDDLEQDPRLALFIEQYRPLQIRSQVLSPYLSDGVWKFMLAVHHREPHAWRDDELELLREATFHTYLRLERAKAEAALSASERLLSTLLEQLPVGVGLINSAGRWLVSNEILRRFMGDTVPARDAANRWRWRAWDAAGELIPPEQWPGARALRGESGGDNVDFMHQGRDDREVWLHVNAVPYRDHAGALVGAIAVVQDVDAQKRAEEALRASENRLAAIFAQAAVGLSEITAEGKFLRVNDELCKMLGRSREQLLAASIADVTHPDDFPHSVQALRQLLQSKQPISLDKRYVRPDGAIIAAASTLTFLENTRDHGGTVLAVTVDVTERKRIQEALRQWSAALEVRVAERTRELEQQRGRLRRLALEVTDAEQRERKKLAKILHDGLQQMLVAIRMQLPLNELEARRESLLKVRELLDMTLEASRTLSYELSPPTLYDSDLPDALRWLARWFADNHKFTCVLAGWEKFPPITESVKTFLFNAIRELLLNAVKHSHVRSAVVEHIPAADGHLQIDVRDEGAGFDPAVLDHAAEDAAGFGLFSIRERLASLGGEMTIDAAPGRGARFSLCLPMAEPLEACMPTELEAAPRAESPEPWEESLEPKIRILLVDDHQIMREGLALMLLRRKHFEVVGEAGDGREALELVDRLNPNIVLMDINMPRMDGIETTRRLKQRHPEVQVIGLSLHAEADRAQAMHDAGASAYVSKVGDPRELFETIERLGGAAAAPA